MVKKILLGVAAVLVLAVAVVLVLAASKPDSYAVERSATLDAPVEAVFGLVNDFRRWPDWSPWEDLDPAMTRAFSGSPQGTGAVYAWDGDSNAGAGRMEILESRPLEHVRIQLDFERPLTSSNITTFTMAADGARTRVNWTMQGANSFPFKLMQVFMDMDTLVGRDFERGLARLEAAAAREPRATAGEATPAANVEADAEADVDNGAGAGALAEGAPAGDLHTGR